MCVFGALDQLSADVPLNRASPNRAFEASKLGHPACGSGISSNANSLRYPTKKGSAPERFPTSMFDNIQCMVIFTETLNNNP